MMRSYKINPKNGEVGVDWWPHIACLVVKYEKDTLSVAPFFLIFGYAFRIGRNCNCFWRQP